MKRLISVLCVLALLLSSLVVCSTAADAPITGQIGDDVWYELDRQTGVLTVTGTGAMWNYSEGDSPLRQYGGQIRRVQIEEGVTFIGRSCFMWLSGLWDVQLPQSLIGIGRSAFSYCDRLETVVLPENMEQLESVAFSGCNELKSVYFKGTCPDFCSNLTQMEEEGLGYTDPFEDCSDDLACYYLQADAAWEEEEHRDYKITRLYSDVSADAWYVDAVIDAHRYDLMDGVGGGRFSPNAQTTRAMLPQVLYRLAVQRDSAEPSASNPFADVPADAWFAEAVCWAAENGIVQGVGEEQFAPGNALTREQVAVMLYRFARYMELDLTADAALTGFSDAGQVSSWAGQGVRWAVTQGLMEGSDGKLNPQGTATRAQLAALLSRMVRQLGLDIPRERVTFYVYSNGDYSFTDSRGRTYESRLEGSEKPQPLEPIYQTFFVDTTVTFAYQFYMDSYVYRTNGTETEISCGIGGYQQAKGSSIHQVSFAPDALRLSGTEMEYEASYQIHLMGEGDEVYVLRMNGTGADSVSLCTDEAGNVTLTASAGEYRLSVYNLSNETIDLGTYSGSVMIPAGASSLDELTVVQQTP